uniref:Sulfotransferase n=1 Tax=Arundo donax TaxID=35708 RepID=A0A0A9HTD0_ARUDO
MAARTNTADAGASALEPAPPVQVPSSATTPHANMAELVPSLPLETRWPPAPLRQYGGFWLPENILPGVAAVHARFDPRPSDILLASFIKSGTTWLKALAFATMNRAAHPPSDADHPLRRRNPHDCVKFLELGSVLVADADASGAALDALEALPAPRLLSTHLPWSLLPRRVGESGCRVVYICRDPKDTLVSLWSVHKKMAVAGVDQFSFAFNDAFELFCEGRNIGGSQPRHVLEYWEEKQRRPGKVLFLVYEEVLREPERNLKRLAEFMGCAFTEEEEEAGVVQEIVELCSIDKMKNLEVNKKGTSAQGVRNEVFFRKGVTGD